MNTQHTLTICFDHHTGPERPTHAGFRSADFATEAEAREFVARYPKAAGLKVTTCTYPQPKAADGTYPPAIVTWFAYGDAVLAANGANGGKNETGIKRLHRWAKVEGVQLGGAQYRNTYTDLTEALAAIDGMAVR